MTLDPNIALGFRGMQLTDPMEHAGRAMALSQMGMQQRYMQSQIDEKTRLSALAAGRQKAFLESGGDSNKFLSSLGQMGDIEGAQAYQEHLLNQQKSEAELDDKRAGTQQKRMKIISEAAAFGFNGGTLKHAQHVADVLDQSGLGKDAAFVRELIDENPNATPEQIRSFFKPYISSQLSASDLLLPKFEDIGGSKVNVNPNVQVDPLQKTQTPESIASNAVAREGHNVTREGHNVTREGHKVTMRGQDLVSERAKDTETRLSTAQQRLDHQNEQAISGAQGSKALIAEMRQLVKDNPRGTATPLAGPARLAESMKGVFDPGAKAGPAIRFTQRRDMLLATIDGLRRDGRMSNQDRQRLENAVGSGMTTPENTIDALNTVEEIIDRMGGNKGAATPEPKAANSDYLERRKKLLGY